MSSERELDEGIKSIKSAWRREHTARTNLKRMLEQAEAENAKLREYLTMACEVIDAAVARGYNAADSSIKNMHTTLKDLGIEVDG